MRELYKKHMPVNMTSLNKLRTSIGTTGYLLLELFNDFASYKHVKLREYIFV